MTGASRLSVQRLGAFIASYKRWQRFCLARGWNYRTPSPIMVSDFLKEVTAGGPTAASSMHACLKWCTVNLGAPFQMDHSSTRHYRFHAIHHTGHQAPELQPWEFLSLALLMAKAQGSHKILLAQILMVAMSCVRFEHLQRSQFVAPYGLGLEFMCAQGKARKQGAGPGYKWCMPPLTVAGQSVSQVLLDFYTRPSCSRRWHLTRTTSGRSPRVRPSL